MKNCLESYIGSFFRKAKSKNALLFTTFGLDEIIFTKLLKKYEVNRERRIIVCHDIMKRKNSGYLRNKYPNSHIISVDLRKTKKDNKCPIFHSKIWMEISKRPFKCIQLAIHSFNLTSFHFDESKKTHEMIMLYQNKEMQLPNSKLFEKETIFNNKAERRIILPPETLCINLTQKISPKIEISPHPVFKILKEHLEGTGDKIRKCCAPFINCRALRKLERIDKDVDAWRGVRKRDSTALHMKCIEGINYIYYGSFNLTAQALIGYNSEPINHETIVISKKYGTNLCKICKGFQKYKVDDLSDKEPADIDEEGRHLEPWLKCRNLRKNAPESIKLEIRQKNGKRIVRLAIKEKRHFEKGITIYSYDNNCEKNSIKIKKDHLGSLDKSQQERLISIILSPPCMVKGMLDNKEWETELDLGELWIYLDFIKQEQKYGRKGNNGRKKTTKKITNGKKTHKSFPDVREMRKNVYLRKKTGQEIYMWSEWIADMTVNIDEDLCTTRVPKWCLDLKLCLEKNKNG